MNKNDNLMIPYYQSDYWKNLLANRVKTLKEDSLLIKTFTFAPKTQRQSTSLTNRTIIKVKQSNLPTLNSLKRNKKIKDIIDDISFDESTHGQNSNEKSIFRRTSTSFTYLKMKERWNHKINHKETNNNSPLTHLVFPSLSETTKSSKVKNIDHYNKTKYLSFLKEKGMMKANLYYK